MQIVVAGASGFIGSEVVATALKAGHQVFALVRDQSAFDLDQEAMAEGRLICLPLGAEPEVLAEGFGLAPGARWVLAAGLNRGWEAGRLERSHAGLVRTLMEGATQLAAERVVLLSCVGARCEGLWAESKRASEALVRAGGRPWAILRAGPVYGVGDTLLDEIGAWMQRSPFIPRFLEEVSLQPVYVGDMAEALLAAGDGDWEVGGPELTWGTLLQLSAQAAGKSLVGPRLNHSTQAWIARNLGDRGWLSSLVPFDTEAWHRHQAGYVVARNALQAMLGRESRTVQDYLAEEWAYRVSSDS